VGCVERIRNPIRASRLVLDKSPHVYFVAEGAERFAQKLGMPLCRNEELVIEREIQRLKEAQEKEAAGHPDLTFAGPLSSHDTVGCVALDANGNIAAGTSTGGTTAKLWGRVGDSPIIGAGTYAQNGVCGVSATGTGEYFIRIGVARDICARMELRHESAERASQEVFAELDAIHGDGGVIVMDGRGHTAWRFNTSGMYRARLEQGGQPVVQIFANE